MEDRPLRVPATADPRFLNRDAGDGLAVGELIFLTEKPGIGMVAAPALGALAGGMYGKRRLSHEQKQGRLVDPPSLFNKTALIGAAQGLFISGLIGLFSPLPPSITLGVAAAATAIGSVTGYLRMREDYEAARSYVAKYGEYNPYVQEMGIQSPEVITPVEAMLLEKQYAHERKHKKSHVERVQQAADQPPPEMQR